MKVALSLVAMALISGCGARAKTEPIRGAPLHSTHNERICLLAGAPPTDVKYLALGRIKATKRTYGSVDELGFVMAQEARKLGADAIINLQSSQRFKGPLPWRITSPTGDGTAIKLLPESPKINCSEAGGKIS